MNKFVLIILTFLFLTNCKDKASSNLKEMKNEFRIFIEDKVFSLNGELEIIQLEAISYKTIDENFIDSIELKTINSQIESYKKLAKSSLELANLKRRFFGPKDLDDAKQAQEKLDFYIKRDSLIRDEISKRKNPKKCYQAKFFLKAIAKDNKKGKSENYLDTLDAYFNYKLKIIVQ